ncbi:MAG: hypothetical protein RMM58_15720 [Chloroflexota bacterium]|nr:hypothetical protein [Dehalococcoidia bacterium]MDW8255320.1 hypothetical protein [Chloroflexota bacterium]
MRRLLKAGALALTVAGLAAMPLIGVQPAAAQQAASWPPVISEMAQVTVGNLTGLLVVVSNRTSNQHAFVDVRVYLPASARVTNTYAGSEDANRGKVEGLAPDGQQVGWINHFVRAGQAQGPFYVVADNGGQPFETWSWLWFATGGEFGTSVGRVQGIYVSPRIRTDAPVTLPGGLQPAAPGGASAQ